MIKRYKASNQRRTDNVLINRKRIKKPRTLIKRCKASNQRRADNILKTNIDPQNRTRKTTD